MLVEESPVPQLSLLQTSSSPVFKLVSNVLHLVHNETKTSGELVLSTDSKLPAIAILHLLYF